MRERRDVLSPDGFGGGGGTPIFQPGEGGGLRPAASSVAKVTNGGSAAADAEAIEVKPKIRAFGQAMEAGHHGKEWRRSTNKDGTGATHVKSFHCKLAADALGYLDEQVNEWLDTHPDYEVKLVTTSVGEWTGKVKEPHLIVQVWV